jgi:hypothetical protein
MLSLAGVLAGRFLVRSGLLELCSWAVFIFFEVAPKLSLDRGLYETKVWRGTISVWEGLVYSPVLDLDRWSLPLGVGAVGGVLGFRVWRRLRGWRRKGKAATGLRGGGGHRLTEGDKDVTV